MVSGGPGQLWVKTQECRLSNGELAFFDELGPAPPLPEWFFGPNNSELIELRDCRAGGECIWVTRRMRAPAEYILAFYRDQTEKAGLVVVPDRSPSRFCPGFRAKSTEHSFHIHVYERKGVSLWNIGLDTESYKKRKWVPRYLHFLDQNSERITMRSEGVRPKECWAALDALRYDDPPVEKHSSLIKESIQWYSLPEWVQFGIEKGKQGELFLWEEENGSNGWNAQFTIQLVGDPRSVFEYYLDCMETQGFRVIEPQDQGRGYYISLLGDWPTAHFQSGAGDEVSICAIDAYRHWALENQWDIQFAYCPAPETPPPPFNC